MRVDSSACVQNSDIIRGLDDMFQISSSLRIHLFFDTIAQIVLQQILILECLYTGEETQVERAGDLDGFQGEGGRAERESDWINHLCVHQQLGTLTAVSQAGLQGERTEKVTMRTIFRFTLMG